MAIEDSKKVMSFLESNTFLHEKTLYKYNRYNNNNEYKINRKV